MPPDAVLMINGERHTSPAQVRVKRDENVSIQCYKEGYMPYQRTIGYHLSTTGTLDVIGIFIFLLPGLGLFCAGSDSLEETDINVDLYQK